MNFTLKTLFFRSLIIIGAIQTASFTAIAKESAPGKKQVAPENTEQWFRHAAISPNGKSIAFSYQGDLYLVASSGGLARALTQNNAWDGHPVWSRDGKQLAFASDRHGNLDIFLMPAVGGKATRITYHSADDIPNDFSVSGDAILFSSARTDSFRSSIFPTSRLAELYEIETSGGTPRMVSTPIFSIEMPFSYIQEERFQMCVVDISTEIR